MGDTRLRDDLVGVEVREVLGEAGVPSLGTGVCMAMAITFGDLDRCLAMVLDGSCVNSSTPVCCTIPPPTSSDESEDDKPFAEILDDASGAISAMLPISELPAAAPEVDSSPKRAVLSELVVVISVMKTEGPQTNELRLSDAERYG